MASNQTKLMILDDVLTELECMVCTETMVPPISMCELGHSFCHTCKTKLRSCPNCRAAISDRRNYSLENIYSQMFIPCKNQGCDQEVKGIEMKTHEESCDFASVWCPLGKICNCYWRGERRSILAHCLEDHPGNTFKNNIRVSWPNVPNIPIPFYSFIIEAHGHLFKLHCDMNRETGLTKGAVIYMGPQNQSENFRYHIRINGGQQIALIKNQCQWFDDGHKVESRTNVLHQFFLPMGLNYTISISKCEGNEESVACNGNVKSVVDR